MLKVPSLSSTMMTPRFLLFRSIAFPIDWLAEAVSRFRRFQKFIKNIRLASVGLVLQLLEVLTNSLLLLFNEAVNLTSATVIFRNQCGHITIIKTFHKFKCDVGNSPLIIRNLLVRDIERWFEIHLILFHKV